MNGNQPTKSISLSALAPKGIDGRVWVRTLKEQLLSSKSSEPTDEELLYFARVCQASGLDPARREIYGIYRNVKQKDGTYKPKLSIQTSIDGLRVTAERGGQYAGSKEPEFQYDSDFKIQIVDRGSNKIAPNKARVTVLKMMQGLLVETTRTANWMDYYPGDREGAMWRRMPETMLSKVAEAQALRAAFPNSVAGLYVEEEMQQADSGEDAVDITTIRGRVDKAKNYDDLMDILGDYPSDVQKQITPLVDAKAKELQQ